MAFNKQLKDYYNNKEMTPSSLEEMMRPHSRAKQSLPVRNMAIAAIFLLTFSIIGFQQFKNTPASLNYISSEIAMNHNKRLNVEVTTMDVQRLRNKLNKLDFSLALPSVISFGEYAMVGGRYCSVHGQIAAQIKFKKSNSDELVTLYVTRPIASISQQLPNEQLVDGVVVKTWEENGLFYGTAYSPGSDL